MEVIHCMRLGWTGPEESSQLPEGVAQMPMMPSPVTLPSFFQPTLITPWERSPWPTDREENTWALFTDGSTQHSSTTWKQTAARLQLFLGHPWKAVVKRTLTGSRSSRNTPGFSFCLNGETARCAIIYRFMVRGHRFGCMVRDVEGTRLENWWWREATLNGWKIWIICVLWQCPPKGGLSRKKL